MVVEERGVLGGPIVRSRLEFGPDFGGTLPFAFDPARNELGEIPPVMARHGYYFAAGGHLSASVGVEWQRVTLRAELAAQGLRGVGGPGEPIRGKLEDVRSRMLASVWLR